MGTPEREETDRSVLVIGASGFLGAASVAALRRGPEALRIVGASRNPAAGPVAPDHARALDLDDVDGLAPFLDDVAPARLLLLGALARGADCEADVDRARRLNAEAPEVVARWAARHGARLVHVSTDLVFGAEPPPEGGFREDDPPRPVSTYGRTKADGEARVLAACPAAAVVRLPLLCGNSRGRGLGASDAVVAAVRRGERPRLFVDEWRTPLDVDVAASALVALLAGDARGLLHVSGPERLSRYELGLLALRAHGFSDEDARARIDAAEQADLDTGAPRPSDVSLASERARALGLALASPRATLGESRPA